MAAMPSEVLTAISAGAKAGWEGKPGSSMFSIKLDDRDFVFHSRPDQSLPLALQTATSGRAVAAGSAQPHAPPGRGPGRPRPWSRGFLHPEYPHRFAYALYWHQTGSAVQNFGHVLAADPARPAAFLLGHIRQVCSLIAPCRPTCESSGLRSLDSRASTPRTCPLF